MGETERTNIELARLLIPPEGNDWGAIAHSRQAEDEFVARVERLLADDFETIWRHTAGESETHAGIDQMLDALRRVGESFETLVAVPERFIDLGDSVLVLLQRRGRTVTGLDFDEPGAARYFFGNGRMTRLLLYANQALALTDAGLTGEQAADRGVASDDLPMPANGDD
jgi:ketosteroid isomerase-like protein